jgi:hypothetical protein
MYTTNLNPLLNEILNLKYKQNLVVYNQDEQIYYLIQNKYSIKELEFDLGEYKTIVFTTSLVGTKKILPKKPASTSSSSTKSGGSIEKDIIGYPTFNEDQTITWSNNEYNSLWKKLNSKLQEALATDTEWLQEFMNNCVKSKLEKKQCTFVNPSNLIIPPQILDDETYDFGNTVYNNYFNQLDKSYQNSLLSLSSEKDKEKNYELLEQQLSSLLAKELDFVPI